jgi:lysophospholipase L1-like esterase
MGDNVNPTTVPASYSAAVGSRLLRPKANNLLAGTTPTMPAFTPSAYQTQRRITQPIVAQTTQEGAVLHIGDSITECFDVLNVSPYSVNFGIGEDTLEAVLTRLSGLAPALRKGRVISLMIGINNVRGGGGAANAKDMFNRLFGWLTGPLIWTKIILTGPPYAASVNTDIVDVNNYAAGLLAGRSSCQIVDINPTVAPAGSLLPQYHNGDGLHLSVAGYGVWGDALRSALKLV